MGWVRWSAERDGRPAGVAGRRREGGLPRRRTQVASPACGPPSVAGSGPPDGAPAADGAGPPARRPPPRHHRRGRPSAALDTPPPPHYPLPSERE
ncbi:MAG: hypothetical protein D6696_16090 [Acidobacteria bacterium]|nr:MAG: hypothetical protein D6696_16090 [Acidobacteriota bacterium]